MKYWFLAVLFFCFLGVIWGFLIEPNLLVVRSYNLNLPQFKGLRIVFASDWHIAPWQEPRLNKTINKINSLHPDIIILGGDFVKGHKFATSMTPEKIAQHLGNLKAKYGTFAVLGNHDWYLNGKQVRKELERNNIKVLENENVQVKTDKHSLYIAGVADILTRKPDIRQTLQNIPLQKTIFISHSPDIFPDIKEKLPLILSGHTHGGQVKAPFLGALIVPSKYGTRYAEGEFWEASKRMIVSKGLGTSLLPVRFNCPPEIVLLEFSADD